MSELSIPGADYSIEIKIRNGRILRLMLVKGIRNANQLAIAAAVSPADVGAIINLKIIPINRMGEWRPQVKRMALALDCDPEDMFSDEQRTSFMASNKRIVEISQAEVDQLLEAKRTLIESPEDIVSRGDRSRLVAEAVRALPARERYVLTRRFGLGGGDEETLEEIGKTMRVTREQIRQIEGKALRRLKHPAIRRVLREFA